MFKELTTDDILSIENFVRNDLPTLLKVALEENEATYTTVQKACFFGPYSAAPEMFRFSPGDTKLLIGMVRYVKRIVDEPEENAGLDHFTDVYLTDKKQLQHEKYLTKSVFGLVFGCLEHKTLLGDKLKELLFTRTKEFLCKHATEAIVQQRDLSLNMVEVLKNGDKIKAKVTCTFCKEDELGAVISVTFRPPGTWILSNLDAHLKKKHPNEIVASEVEPIDTTINESDDENHNVKTESVESFEPHNVEISGHTDGGHGGTDVNTSIECLESKFVQMTTNSSQSSAAVYTESCEDIIYGQLETQTMKMTKCTERNNENVLTNNFGFRQAKLKQEKAIRFCKMDSNGDCFFLATAHQLYKAKVGSGEHIQQAIQLRTEVVKHIKENFSSFFHDLKSRIDIARNATDSEIKTACLQFLDGKLCKPGTWAGMESIKAISDMKNVNIVVMNDDGTSHLPNHLKPEAIMTLQLFFGTATKKVAKTNKERVHYDSIVAIHSNRISSMAREIGEAEGHYTKFVAETAKSVNITIN